MRTRCGQGWVISVKFRISCTLPLSPACCAIALREYERHYNEHHTHRSLAAAAPLWARHQPLGPDRIECLAVLRPDRLGGVLPEYRHAA